MRILELIEPRDSRCAPRSKCGRGTTARQFVTTCGSLRVRWPADRLDYRAGSRV